MLDTAMETGDKIAASACFCAGAADGGLRTAAALLPATKAEIIADRQQIAQLTYDNAQLNSSLNALAFKVSNIAGASVGATGERSCTPHGRCRASLFLCFRL